MHAEHLQLLERPVRLLDLVVDEAAMLSGTGDLAPDLGLALAAAGFSQLFSP